MNARRLAALCLAGTAAAVLAAGLSLSTHSSRVRATVPAAPLARAAQIQPAAAPVGDPRLSGARDALERHDLKAAFDRAEAARKEGVPLPEVLEVEVRVLRQAAYLDREIGALRRWCAAAPGDPQPWLRLFYIYTDLGWRRDAEAASAAAVARAPHNPRCLVTRALAYYRSNEPARGLEPIDEALRLDPANAEMMNLRATILLKASRYSEAEAQLRQALARDPDNISNRLALAAALTSQGRKQEASAELAQVQQRDPAQVEAPYQLGILAEKRGDTAEAKRQLERAAAMDAQYGQVLWHLGRLYLREGRAGEGRKLLETYKKMDSNASAFETAQNRLYARPNDPALHYTLARFHLTSDELPEAIAELRRVLELRPRDASARRDLAAALRKQGRISEARQLSPPARAN